MGNYTRPYEYTQFLIGFNEIPLELFGDSSLSFMKDPLLHNMIMKILQI